MTSVKVAVRVRPLNQREDGSNCIIEMAGEKTRIINPKVPDTGSEGDHAREQFKTREFTFDHSFWSACPTDPNFVTQEQVFAALGVDVVTSAYEGYNVCVFAYGQTGSGKTYTMMGNQEDPGLIPRFCEEMFSRMRDQNATHKTQVSYLEIYNEKVRDLLKHNSNSKPSHKLRIREHPKEGPYVQDLSEHTVVSYEGIASLMNKGNNNRTTAATLMNDVSSRSHAIFTITFTQAKFLDGLPSERQSKIHLVDLAGSERADASGATGQRLKEGGSINKSLVTLGNVISVLAEISEEKGNRSRGTFIPYRDSVLTWLLKDSLGGNAKTIMIATISPSSLNYAETLSTLRYANRAKNIINRPTVNEDPNVRLIRELREEIARLKSLLGGNLDNISSPKVQEKLHENEARIKVLTEEWADKWRESASILQMEKNLELRKEGLGVVLDSTLPHLIGIDDDILSTGIMLYHLKEGITTIGSEESEEPQDICISGAEVEDQHCVIEYRNGNVTLHPIEDALCCVNGSVVTEPVNLTQGAVVVLGRTNMFRFNHPAEAQKLKQMRKSLSTLSLSRSPVLSNSRTSLLSHSMTDLYRSHDSLPLTAGMKALRWEFEESHREEQEVIDVKQQEIEELELKHKQREEEWQKQQAILDQQLQAKQQQLSALEHEMESLQETVSPAKSLEEALQRLEQQEASKLLEMQHFREELLQELKVQSLSLEKNKTGLAESICELDKQIANGCTVLFSMQEEVVNKRSALQENRMKEEEQIAILRSELTSIREELALEREKILSHDSELAKQYTALTEEEANLRKQLDHLDHSKNAEWKKILDSLSEENYRIEEAWHDISEQETEVKHKLEGGLFADSQEKEELEKYKQELEKARLLLKEEEDRVATAQQKEMEHIEAEMEKWAQYKEQEINSMQRKRDSVLRKQSQKMDILCAQSEDKLSAITLKQEQCHEIDMSLEAFSRKIQSELSVKQEHQKQLEELKEQRTRELSKSEKDGITLKKEFDAKLEQLKMSYERDIKSIQEEKERLLILRRPTKELLEQQQALDLKVQECESLREEINTLKEELLAHEHQQEDALDHELDDIEFKKLQLQELVHQERINALVEQEVKRRLFEEKVEREKQRRIEREKDRQERDKEIRSLKSVHEREMRQLRAKFENSNGHSVSNPYGVTVTPLSTFEDNRKKLVRQLSSTGPPPSINITIPNYELRGTGRDAHYEYEVKIKIGDETWSVFRRYSRFRELHQNMRKKYPAVDILVFPPRKLFHRTERVASERRVMLEQYLSNLLEVCMRCPDSPLQNQYLSKHVLAEFDQFFHRGLFEHARHIAT